MAGDGGYVGRPLLRREDRRLLTGKGQFIADLAFPHMLHMAVVRSQRAHARIRSIDISRASAMPGVACILTGERLLSLLPAGSKMPTLTPPPVSARWSAVVKLKVLDCRQTLLAVDKVRHVGEALAIVVANSRYEAEDAADLVEVDLEPLPAAVDANEAAAEGGPLVHEHHGTNVVGEYEVGKGNVQAVLAAAPRKLKRRLYHHRYGACPMECRGVVSVYDLRTDSTTVWSSLQVPHLLKREVAEFLRLPEPRVRCVALDVGGGFGGKGHPHPEDLLVPFLARLLDRPVKWIEDRREHFMASCHSRDQWHDVEVAFDNDGRILALDDNFITDMGAWERIGMGISYNTATHLLGPYKIDHYSIKHKTVATNKVPNAPYRGAGRPEATFVMERIIDIIANEVGVDAIDIRRRNMIRPEEMPYPVNIPYRDGLPVVYDKADFPAMLEKALDALGGLPSFRNRQTEAQKSGRYLGLGVGCYVEGTGYGPFESASVRIDTSGKIHIAGGSCSQGQGMETIFAQIAADAWSVDPQDVYVSLADTAIIPHGYGTVASRSTLNMGGAIYYASERLRTKVFKLAGHMLECSPDDLELKEGNVCIKGIRQASVSLAKVAQLARPGWSSGRPADIDPGLEETYYYETPKLTWACAAHAAIVEVDVDTGRTNLQNYVIAHECGVVVNPLLLEGQMIGAAIQGIGGTLLEDFYYDREGQLLVGSFMDYMLPTASDVPNVQVIHVEGRSESNPLGVKGGGEGGAIASPAAIANAISDALAPFKMECNVTPITPEKIAHATCAL